jgi:opacity protein-like surface antigen
MPEFRVITPPLAWQSWAVPLVLSCLLFIAAGHASAQSRPGDWHFEFTPYLWAAAMKGDIQTAVLPKTSVDESFTDILDVLDFGAMAAFEARKNRWGLLLDAIYLKTSQGGSASRTGPGGATLTVNAELEMKQTILSAAAAYRVVDVRTLIDLIGGVRYNKMKADASLEASLFGQTGFASRSGDKDWVDPYVGVRVQHMLSDRWTLAGYADYGGFGAGSDVTYQLIAGADYKFSKSVSGKLGYRYLKVDYDKDNFLYDATIQGPYLGVAIRF